MNNVKVIKELNRIMEDNNGLLLPQNVVDAARPKRSPLHNRFEWNNTEAANEYRLWQARQLISVCVRVIPQSTQPVSCFVSLSTDRVNKGGGYRALVTVLSDAELREQLVADAQRDMATFQLKYAQLRELAGVFEAMQVARRAA